MVGTQGFHLDAGIRLLAAQAVRIAVFACLLNLKPELIGSCDVADNGDGKQFQAVSFSVKMNFCYRNHYI